MFPSRSRILFNNLQHMADVMAYDMERQLTRQWRRAFDQWEREALAQRYQHRDRHHKEFDQVREEQHRHRDNHEEFGKTREERQAHRDQYREFDQAREERHRHRDHHEGFDQAHAERQRHKGRYQEFDKAREERRRYMYPFEQFDYGFSRGMRESFRDMNKNMEMEIENQTPPNVGKDVYYKMVMRTEENGHVKVKRMEKEPGSEWKIMMEEFKRGEKPAEDAKLKTQDKAHKKVQERIAEPNQESQKIINEKS